jgi:hypothetical protein
LILFFTGENGFLLTSSVYVDVTSARVGNRILSNGDSGEIIWNPGARETLDKKYLYPIPEADLLKNPILGQKPDGNSIVTGNSASLSIIFTACLF